MIYLQHSKEPRMKIGYTTGIFDMFHAGHLEILQEARKRCDFLIVGVATDELCEKLKNKTPVIPFKERFEIVKAIKYVDKVFAQHHTDRDLDFKKHHFDIMFKGDDWAKSPDRKNLENQMAQLGGGVKVVYLRRTRNFSSSKLRQVIENITQE